METLIQKVTVTGLFGKYNHTLPHTGKLGSPAILYGDNGVGKSTILKIIFDTLSPSNNRGHRKALGNTKFESLRIELRGRHTVTVEKRRELGESVLRLRTYTNDQLMTEWVHTDEKHFPEGLGIEYEMYEAGLAFNDRNEAFQLYRALQDGKKRKPQSSVRRGDTAFLSHLEEICPRVYYLNADRKLISDAVQTDRDEYYLRQAIRNEDHKRFSKFMEEYRAHSLTTALGAASRWINEKVLSSANRGSIDVHAAYQNVVYQLARNYETKHSTSTAADSHELLKEIKEIEALSKSFSKYGLAVALEMDAFVEAIEKSEGGSDIAARLVSPYIESLKTRFEALKDIYEIIEDLVVKINSFLSRKSLRFTLSKGFSLVDDGGIPLEPASLSSGEQQLLLIFAHVISSRDQASVFIIDEPEISLNVKWQRKLVSSLLSVANKQNVQFLFASHSFEIIAQHRSSVVKVTT